MHNKCSHNIQTIWGFLYRRSHCDFSINLCDCFVRQSVKIKPILLVLLFFFPFHALFSRVNCCWCMRQRHPARAVVRLCGQVRDSRLQFAVLQRHSYWFQTGSVYLKMDNPVKGLTTVSWQQVSVPRCQSHAFFFLNLRSSYRLLCCNFKTFQNFNNCLLWLSHIQKGAKWLQNSICIFQH